MFEARKVATSWIQLIDVNEHAGDHGQCVVLFTAQLSISLKLPFVLCPQSRSACSGLCGWPPHPLIVDDDLKLIRWFLRQHLQNRLNDRVLLKRWVIEFNVGDHIDDANHFVTICNAKLKAARNGRQKSGAG